MQAQSYGTPPARRAAIPVLASLVHQVWFSKFVLEVTLMFRSKSHFLLLPISVVSVLILVCLIARQHAPGRSESVNESPTQNASGILLEAALTKSASTEAPGQDRLRIEAAYSNLQLSFEPNQGQTDPRVRFISRGSNRTLWLTANEAVLAVGRPRRAIARDAKQANMRPAPSPQKDDATPAVLRMKFAGADPNPVIAGESKQTGTVNYFFGKPDQWRTKIPVYSRVRYRSLYPGIDLVFYGNNRQLEYDLVVSPGADPGKIRLAIGGAQKINIDAEGNLVLGTSQGDVIQQKPKIYQRKGATLTAVAGDYVITGKNEVGFRLGNYDRNAAVVIDPVLRYSTFLGGGALDAGRGIAVDSSKRAVVAGLTCSPDFPRTAGPTTFHGCSAFVTKFDFTGSRLIFSTFIGESASEVFDVGGMALDSGGNTYITGIVEFRGFPTTPGAFQTELKGDFDAFVTKLNANGTALVYSTFLGGGSRDAGHSIAVDSAGNAYVTGDTESSDFPTTAGAFQRQCKLFDSGCNNSFVTKLNASGSGLLYSTFLGGTSNGIQPGEGIAVDRLGNAFITGFTDAADFPTTSGSAQPVFPGGIAAFVSELSSSGSHLVYSTFLGGGVFDGGRAIALDSLGNAFVTGFTQSKTFPVKNAFQPHCAFTISSGCFNAFVTKLSTSGRLLYSTYLGGPLGPSGIEGKGTGIAVTADGKAYIAGITSSASFPTTQTAFQRIVGGTVNVSLTKLDSGGQLIYSSYLGGSSTGASGGDIGNGPAIALDRDTNAYLTGTTTSSFPVTPGAFRQNFSGGESDAFVAKVVAGCPFTTVNRTVTICSPVNGSTVKSPVHIVSGTKDLIPVRLTQVYLDGKKIYKAPLSSIDVNLPISAGTHRLAVQALDTAGVFFSKTITINVRAQ
jgi:hypothetical protein